ncbi:hypothetical protein D3C76_811450 [compost metagenome]
MTDYQPIDIAPWLRKHASRLQSPFEQLFVRNVLAHVPGINLDSVDTQYCFTDTEGGTRYCDFVIQEGETLRIAIEIDGYDKTGRGAGMSHAEFVDWQRRHASLVAQGWDVIRFANYDVKHSAKRCIEHISLLLRSERSKNSYMESLIVREHALRAQLEQQTGAANVAQKELKKVQGLVAAATTTKGLSGSEHKRLHQLEQAQLEVANLKRETKLMRTTIWAFVVLIMAMMYFMFHRMNEPAGYSRVNDAPSASKESLPITLATISTPSGESLSGQSCKDPLNWSGAVHQEGQVKAFAGKVVEIVSRGNTTGKPTFINLGEAFPSKRRLTVIIWGEDAEIFRESLKHGLQGRTICVRGKVGRKDGVAQIILKDRAQLSYPENKGSAENAGAYEDDGESDPDYDL